ncbi:MAG: ATP phosphoribosyltransferase [Bacteroidales bacterium]|nr:ATP phosphoribosyltransferase [Bacteroidales bacterium]
MLRIAVQAKGRLFEETMELMTEAGIKLSNAKRTLLIPSRNFPIEVLFLRDDDIPQAVASGVADVGIVGENEFVEKEQDAQIVKRLGFSKCRISLAIPKEADYQGIKWFDGKKIATSYPVILQNFLNENKIKSEIHVISGSVEVAPGIGLSDAIFDIVSSGSTLVSNHLKEVEVVMQSEAVLIGHSALSDEKKEILDELMFRFDSVQKAEGKKYILLNAPNENLAEIISILPGMKSPTIISLAEEGWSSVHSVIDDKNFWSIINKIKKLGAEGILVVPIEKMIL